MLPCNILDFQKNTAFITTSMPKKNWPCCILIFPILINGRVVAGGLCPPPWRPGPELQKASFVPSAKNKLWSGILGKFQYLLVFLATSHMANAFLRKKNPASTSIFWEDVHGSSGKASYMCSDFEGPTGSQHWLHLPLIYQKYNSIPSEAKYWTKMPSQSPTTTVHAACAEFVDEPVFTEPNHASKFFVENWQVHPYFSLNWCYLTISTSSLNNIQNQAGATGKCHAPPYLGHQTLGVAASSEVGLRGMACAHLVW